MKELNYERVFNILVKETSNYITRNRLNAMVLGISGGIDSTVVAAICHEVSKQTGIPLIGRSLPIKNKNDEFSVSKLVGNAFCDDFKVVNLSYMCQHVIQAIYDGEGTLGTPISKGNIQARLRMIYLYNLAGINRGLVMDTDNFYQIVNGQFGTIAASNPFDAVLKVNNDGGYTIQGEGVYLKGELLDDPLDFLNVEQPKSYFY